MATIIALIVFVIVIPIIMSAAALLRSGTLKREIAILRDRVEKLTLQLETELLHRAPPEDRQTETGAEETPEPPSPAEESDAGPVEDASMEPEVPEEAVMEGAVPPIAARTAPDAAVVSEGFEQKLTVRWMVWLGGVAIALAGVFLVKYAAELGLLGPAARCAIGLLLGIVLVGGGEWVRRNPKHGLAQYAPGSYVPQALAAAGLFIAFASVYAAYGLYDLLDPVVVFAALGVIAFSAFALSLLQGPFVALLGLIGGLVTPLLVSTEAPSAIGLFIYLAAILAACFAVVRYRQWWFLSLCAIGGGALWALLWMATEHQPPDVYVVGTYLIALAAASLLFWWDYDIPPRPANWWADVSGSTMQEASGWLGGGVVALLMPVLVQASDQNFASIATVAILSGLLIWFARRTPSMDALPIIAGVVVLFVVSTWQLPGLRQSAGEFPLPGGWRFLGPILDDELVPFASTTVFFGALFAASGFFCLWQAKRPALWAGVSSGVPLGLLVLSYFRIGERVPDLNWSIIALALAGMAVAATRSLIAHRDDQGRNQALAIYAAAAVAALSFAMTMIFDRALLTVALSLQLPGLAWIARRTGVASLRWIAGALAVVVLARLALNWNVLDYPLGVGISSNWILYGYGIPAVSFYWAARQFRQLRDDDIVTLLEGGALLFVTLLVSLEIRVLSEGTLGSRHYTLFEQSLQTISWLVIAITRMWSHAVAPRFTKLWGARILLVLATAQTVFLQLLASNPILTGDPVGSVVIFNTLLLAYAAPAGLFLLAVRLSGEVIPKLARTALLALGFLLAFVFITLSVQHFYQGPVLSGVALSDAEYYSYSAAWLCFALVLLALGVWRHEAMLRYASLAVLLLTVAKVFLLDMGDLTGLLRVASFLGLGLCLVGIGYVYQRFVFPRPASDQTGEAEEA